MEYVVRAGDPVTEIVRIADEVKVDAVVVGASTQAGHRLVGSVAVAPGVDGQVARHRSALRSTIGHPPPRSCVGCALTVDHGGLSTVDGWRGPLVARRCSRPH